MIFRTEYDDIIIEYNYTLLSIDLTVHNDILKEGQEYNDILSRV